LQIAFILLQLLEQGSLLRRLVAEWWGQTPWQMLGGLMNVAWLLLESLRRDAWAPSWFDAAAAAGVHISFQAFDSSERRGPAARSESVPRRVKPPDVVTKQVAAAA
jgi:hypothetical protein